MFILFRSFKFDSFVNGSPDDVLNPIATFVFDLLDYIGIMLG